MAPLAPTITRLTNGQFYYWLSPRGYPSLSRDQPSVAWTDDSWRGIQSGDIVGSTIGTIQFDPPEGFAEAGLLPAPGEIRIVWFHENLWGRAQELPSYNKVFWDQLARTLGA